MKKVSSVLWLLALLVLALVVVPVLAQPETAEQVLAQLPGWAIGIMVAMGAVIVVLIAIVIRLVDGMQANISLVRNMIPLENLREFQQDLREAASATANPYDESLVALFNGVTNWALGTMGVEGDPPASFEFTPDTTSAESAG